MPARKTAVKKKTKSPARTRTSKDPLTAAYESLDPFETDVLEVLALFYKPVSIAKIVRVLKKRGVRDSNNRMPTQAGVDGVIESLRKLGLTGGSNYGRICERSIVERVTRRMIADGRFEATEPLVRDELHYARWGNYVDFLTDDHAIACVRLALYARDFERLDQVLDDVALYGEFHEIQWHPISTILNNPFDPEWLSSYPPSMQGLWMCILLSDIMMSGEAPEPALAHARGLLEAVKPDVRVTLAFRAAEIAFLQGRFDDAHAGTAEELGTYAEMLRARSLLVTGMPGEAAAVYETCLNQMKKATGKRKPKFTTVDWLFFILALLAAGESHWPRALELARWGARDKTYGYQVLCEELARLIRRESGEADANELSLISWRLRDWIDERDVTAQLVCLLVDHWLHRDTIKQDTAEIVECYERVTKNGYRWLESEFADLLERAGRKYKDYGEHAAALRETLGTQSLSGAIRPLEDWERTLRALVQATKPEAGPAGREKRSRLVWFVTTTEFDIDIEPKEQKCSPTGRWSKGRTVSLRRLHEERQKMDFLTEQDRKVCDYITPELEGGYWRRPNVSYFIPDAALLALAGHPHVYLTDTGAQVEVVTATPELQVTKTRGKYKLTMIPGRPPAGGVHVEREGDTRLVVYEYTPDIVRIAGILGEGVTVPGQAKDEVLKAVGNVSSLVTVHSDIGTGDESIPKVPADATPVVQLLPAGEGLLVHLRVRPLPDGGPVFAPATGGEVVIAEVNGTRVQAERDFETEREMAAEVVSACPTLAGSEAWESEWHLDAPEACLEFLMELESCGPAVHIQWPKGQKYAIQGSAGADQFRMKIKGGHNWFEVSGEVQVNDDLVLDMQRLIELTADSNSRFVDLGEGQFVALTRAFRRKLDELRDVSETRDDGLRLHALAAPLMDDLVDQAASVKANKKWKEQVKRLENARALDPAIPSTLRATLRDYQIDGYKWLARLAEWGVGACLADDMGLGKTVQILAVMLDRAGDGPQLVVAPTSVCANWEEEARRFAPTLRVHRLGLGNREATVNGLGAFDVLVCSYGLMQSENELLKGVAWQTIVLDEAQAIKNMATKRSKAAMALDGAFKIIATGTPIENHLGELWNLYRFINPGFLGSLEHFNEQFAVPIEKHEDRDTRHHLRNLIQPFILRRLKEDVLDELPARTDIVLHVEPSEKERAFYEALRRRALKQLSDAEEEPGKHHVRILAEIMRLRRACCNPRLVDENSILPSAKLEVFEAVLDDLMENRHKALVFSQFVDHLHILRELLDRKGVGYQYLDGGTPARGRKKAVDAFQAGEGDVFLISLRAGGQGLNLTAADYVIHMDPWWNPAVEDQASDRAHRIGQQRPVTVYRLVARDTIEDQITDLHHRKRDLANSLLEGSDVAGKISSEELLALLRNG